MRFIDFCGHPTPYVMHVMFSCSLEYQCPLVCQLWMNPKKQKGSVSFFGMLSEADVE